MSSFALRMPDHVMEQAKKAAEQENTSVNQLLTSFIAQGLGQRRGIKMLRDRAAKGDVDAALAILNKAPDVPPDEGDQLSREASSGALAPR